MALLSTIGARYAQTNIERSQAPWLNWDTRHTYKAIKSNGFALVPQMVFDSDQMPTYFKSTGLDYGEQSRLVIDEIELARTLMVYDHKGTESHNNLYACLINQLLAYQNLQSQDYIHFHLDIDSLLIVVVKGGKLQMANQFSFSAKEDILYYLAASVNNFELDLKTSPITYSGYLRPKTDLKKLLHEYFPDLKPTGVSASLNFDTCINPMHQVFYADVFTLPLCAL
ncbi:MAG: DUF3822 family protein [Bacteroidia bacterium]